MEKRKPNANRTTTATNITEEEREKKTQQRRVAKLANVAAVEEREELRTIQEGYRRTGAGADSRRELWAVAIFAFTERLSIRTMWSYVSIKRQYVGTVGALD